MTGNVGLVDLLPARSHRVTGCSDNIFTADPRSWPLSKETKQKWFESDWGREGEKERGQQLL